MSFLHQKFDFFIHVSEMDFYFLHQEFKFLISKYHFLISENTSNILKRRPIRLIVDMDL